MVERKDAKAQRTQRRREYCQDGDSRRLQLVALLAIDRAFGNRRAGAWLRLHEAGESLWVDELHTAWCAEGSLAEVASRSAIGNQSPLYFYAVWFITQVFGHSEWSLRALSLACGIALPAALFGLVRNWTSATDLPDHAETQPANDGVNLAALVAALLVTFDPLAIFYAQESRPYACVQLVAVEHLFVFARCCASPRCAGGRRGCFRPRCTFTCTTRRRW